VIVARLIDQACGNPGVILLAQLGCWCWRKEVKPGGRWEGYLCGHDLALCLTEAALNLKGSVLAGKFRYSMQYCRDFVMGAKISMTRLTWELE